MACEYIDLVLRDIRLRGYSIHTEKTYTYKIRWYIRYISLRHPQENGKEEVRDFLSWLANDRHVAPNTQRVAPNALVFLYHKFFNQDLGHLGFTLAKQRRYLPVVWQPEEVARILAQVSGRNYLILDLMYDIGLRVSECLRVQDINLQGCSLMIRNSKGWKDLNVLFGESLSDLII